MKILNLVSDIQDEDSRSEMYWVSNEELLDIIRPMRDELHPQKGHIR